MRKGAQGMAQSMQQKMGQGPGPAIPAVLAGRANQNTIRSAARCADATRRRHHGQGTGEIDVQRARRILEELRKRFGESFRPQLELDYIERLLKDF